MLINATALRSPDLICDMTDRGGRGDELNVSPDDVLHKLARAARVRDFVHADLLVGPDHMDVEAACAPRPIADLVRIGTRVVDQLLERLYGQARMNNQRERRFTNERYRQKVFV